MVSSGMMGGDGIERVRSRRRGRFDSGAERVKSATRSHSIEAEESLLSCCLIDAAEGGDTIDRCRAAGLTRESFYSREVGVAFVKLAELHEKGVPADAALLLQSLQADGHFEGREGVARFGAIVARNPTTRQAAYFIESVRGLAARRAKHRLAGAIAEGAERGDDEAVRDHLAQLNEVVGDGGEDLPGVMPFSELIGATPREMPQVLVEGLLDSQSKLCLAGSSKSYKTWVLLDLGLSVATGTPWWGMKTVQAPVLFVNMELKVASFEKRVRQIMEAKGIKEAPNFYTWHLRGYARDFRRLRKPLLDRIRRFKIRFGILDPIYKVLGERDENSNGDVGDLLNEVESVVVGGPCAMAHGHHFSKGNQAEKDAKDRSAGAGAWTRDPDALITLTAHDEEGCFTTEYVLRDLPQKKPAVVRWKHPCMEVAPGLDPAALKTAGRPKSSTDEDVAKLVGESDQLTYAELKDRAERAGIKLSSFKRRLHEAKESGALVQVGSIYRRGVAR